MHVAKGYQAAFQILVERQFEDLSVHQYLQKESEKAEGEVAASDDQAEAAEHVDSAFESFLKVF